MLNDVNRRDRDFMRAVRREAVRSCAQGRPLTVRQAVRRAVASPAPSFYLTTDYAWRMLRVPDATRRLRRPRRERMWEELRERFDDALRARPEADPYTVLDELLQNAGSSRFFISEARGIAIYFKLLTNGRNGTQSQQ